jgi:hypothetical protein
MGNFFGWIGLAGIIIWALPYPFIFFLDISPDYALPTAFVIAAVLVTWRPHDDVLVFLSNLVTYAMIFSIWCMPSFFLVWLLHALIDDIRPPFSRILIAAIAVGGTVWHVSKDKGIKREKQSNVP